MKNLYIILGNGFTIDFLNHYTDSTPAINNQIDVRNLFRLGDKINSPWENRPGFLSYKHCPYLWTLGARPSNSIQESTALIEEIITCANMFFDFVNEPEQKAKRLELASPGNNKPHLKAYSELIVYLRHLFSYYNSIISDSDLKEFVATNTSWGWLKFLRSIPEKKYSKITVITYNYDIWLERILDALGISYHITGFEPTISAQIEIIKPHGSISFVPKSYQMTAFGVNYNLDYDGISIDQLEIKYHNLMNYDKGAIIPPAGDSLRLERTSPWAHTLRHKARDSAKTITNNDEVVLCGISYWHVDRREIDELLININQDTGFTFINPSPPRDLNAVLISIFSKYVQQCSSSEIGGILNG